VRGIEPPTFGSTVRLLNALPQDLFPPRNGVLPQAGRPSPPLSPCQAALVRVSRRHDTNLDSRFIGSIASIRTVLNLRVDSVFFGGYI
jgi:hypothetical protein